jgi:hypothetical protein
VKTPLLLLIFAWTFFLALLVGVFVAVYGGFRRNDTVLGIGILVVFAADSMSAVGSALYMSHPTNGDYIGWDGRTPLGCAEYNWTIRGFDPTVPCINPTPADNPYEQPPLHPLAWIYQGELWISEKIRPSDRQR